MLSALSSAAVDESSPPVTAFTFVEDGKLRDLNMTAKCFALLTDNGSWALSPSN